MTEQQLVGELKSLIDKTTCDRTKVELQIILYAVQKEGVNKRRKPKKEEKFL